MEPSTDGAPSPPDAFAGRPAGGPCVLFQSHNRRGLGHLMRAVNLARGLLAAAPGTRVVLHVRHPAAAGFCPEGVEWILDDGASRGWTSTLRAVRPDIVVYDTVVPVEPRREPVPPDAKVVYVMRRATEERHRAILDGGFLDRVDLVIVPHTSGEFDHPIPDEVARRVLFAGPIVRAPEPRRAERLRRRYALQGATPVVVSSAGGGGFTETAEPFFDAVWAAHERLRSRCPALRHVVVLGPQHTGRRIGIAGMEVVDSEPDLVDLFALADLVVCEGGYNSVNEVRLVGAAALFVPGARRWDDQARRVTDLAERGLAVVARAGGPDAVGAQIADLASDPGRLSQLRRRSREHAIEPGNARAVAGILELAA